MPELPEVETVGRALAAVLVGRVIESVTLCRDRLREPLDSLRDPRLPGRRVKTVRRRGRYLIVELDGALALLIHLSMTGVLKVLPADAPRAPHEHILFDIGRGETLRFECTRRFSLVKLVELPAPGGMPEALGLLGPEPLTEAFSADYFRERARGRRTAVKNFRMDNRIVTGVGNSYATEALFEAGISPLRPAEKVRKPEAVRLVAAVKRILDRSIAAGGTTFSDFRRLDGSTGHYALELAIYGRKGRPCPRCGGMLHAVMLGGRTSVYCPHCQR
mgnify:FL=1